MARARFGTRNQALVLGAIRKLGPLALRDASSSELLQFGWHVRAAKRGVENA